MTHSEGQDDALVDLLAGVAGGDRAAFAELYALTSARLFAVLLRILKRTDWAEEALQDSYVRIWRRSESYAEDRGAPMAWLTTIARYRALDLLRARRTEPSELVADDGWPELESRADGAALPDEAAANAQGLGQLQDCLDTLADEPRRSVLLAYYEGYTHSELAQRMQAPLGTVKSWVRRGLQQLRDCLERN